MGPVQFILVKATELGVNLTTAELGQLVSQYRRDKRDMGKKLAIKLLIDSILAKK